MDTKQLADLITTQNIKDLQGYVPGKTLEEVIRDFNPKRIAKLASNENRLGCSPKALEAARKSFDTINNYPDSMSLDLRTKIAEKNGFTLDNVIAGGGSDAIIHQLTRTFFQEGDEVITVNATFVGFFVASTIRNLKMKQVPLTDDYQYDLNLIARAITDKTRAIYLANPNNPTGTYFKKDEFEKLMDVVPDNVLVLMDEAYVEFAKGIAPDYPDSLTYSYPNVITLRTFSKAYGLAGFRVGYAIAGKELISQMLKTKLTFDPTAPSQAAAMAALDDTDFLDRTIHSVTEGRKELYDIFSKYEIQYVASFSNSVMTVFENEEEAIYFNDELLKRGVVVRRLPGFGLSNCVRVSVGLKEDHEQLDASLKEMY